MRILELFLVIAIIGLIASLYYPKVNYKEKVWGIQWTLIWHGYKVNYFMNPDFDEAGAIGLLSN